MTAESLAPGQIARVRQRKYLVEQIVRPKRAIDSTLVRLTCVDDDNQGQPLEVPRKSGVSEKTLEAIDESVIRRRRTRPRRRN